MSTKNKHDKHRAEDSSSDLHLGNSTLQTPEEKQHDQQTDAQKDDKITAVDIDLRETEAQKTFGSDRAGTSERKDNTVRDDQ